MRWPNPILWAGWSDRLVGELMIRGQFDIGAGGGWEWQLFSLLFPPIIIFKCPHIRHSPASLYPAGKTCIICFHLLKPWVRDRKESRWAGRVFPHQGNCRMAHVSIIQTAARRTNTTTQTLPADLQTCTTSWTSKTEPKLGTTIWHLDGSPRPYWWF